MGGRGQCDAWAKAGTCLREGGRWRGVKVVGSSKLIQLVLANTLVFAYRLLRPLSLTLILRNYRPADHVQSLRKMGAQS